MSDTTTAQPFPQEERLDEELLGRLATDASGRRAAQHVPLPLEGSYGAAFAALPEHLRAALEEG